MYSQVLADKEAITTDRWSGEAKVEQVAQYAAQNVLKITLLLDLICLRVLVTILPTKRI